jgi:hypothetical protein
LAKKAMTTLLLPSFFLLQHNEDGDGNVVVAFVLLQHNEDGDDNNVTVTLIFVTTW